MLLVVLDVNVQIIVDYDSLQDFIKYVVVEDDVIIFLIFDWENEESYERVVERYCLVVFDVFFVM